MIIPRLLLLYLLMSRPIISNTGIKNNNSFHNNNNNNSVFILIELIIIKVYLYICVMETNRGIFPSLCHPTHSSDQSAYTYTVDVLYSVCLVAEWLVS